MQEHEPTPPESDHDEMAALAEHLSPVVRRAIERTRALDFVAELEGFQDGLEQEMVRHLSDPGACGAEGEDGATDDSARSDIIRLHQEIDDAQRQILVRLAEVVEARSRETGSHVIRVAGLCYVLARKSGLGEAEAELLRMAAPMHDVGKVGIPDAILHKPGRLSSEEFAVMQTHTTIGYEMLRGSNRRILRAAAVVALQHHERFDGKGYPMGLMGDAISLFGRITCLADVFDALSFDRVYRKAWSLDRILEYVRAERGKSFDPHLVDLFLANLSDFLAVRDAFPAEESQSIGTRLGEARTAPAGAPRRGVPNRKAQWRCGDLRDHHDSAPASPRALLAVADPDRSREYAEVLADHGHSVLVVEDGVEAWQALQGSNGVKLAVLDAELANMSGTSIARLLRKMPCEHYVYLVLLADPGRPGRQQDCLAAGADACVSITAEPAHLGAQLIAARRILALQAEIIGARESLREQATRDPLTGLWNRGAILEMLQHELARAQREQYTFTLIMSDVDHFKRINDSHGHRAGDAVLQEVSTRLQAPMREYDMTGRYGGEEFLTIVPRCEVAFARYVADRLRQRVAEKPVGTGEQELAVTMSFGVATFDPTREVSLDELINQADEALYAAKNAGRNCVKVFGQIETTTSAPGTNI